MSADVNSVQSKQESLKLLLKEKMRQGVKQFPLSYAQEQLCVLNQLLPQGGVYNEHKVYRLKGVLNKDALEKSIHEIVQRHASLRTIFLLAGDKPVQVVKPFATGYYEYIDGLVAGITDEKKLNDFLAAHISGSFNLTTGPLINVKLIGCFDTSYILSVCMHHIVTDGWSMEIFNKELTTLYRDFSSHTSSSLADLKYQYSDYAVFQRQPFFTDLFKLQLEYWYKQLKNFATLNLPTDFDRPAYQTYCGARHFIDIPIPSMQALCKKEKVTPFMIALTVFKILLYRYSAQEDIVVGIPVANRNRDEVKDMIGFFVNTLVFRTDLSGSPAFLELLHRVRKVTLDAFTNQDVPFEKLVEELQPERSLSFNPVFQVLFVFQNVPQQTLQLPGISAEEIEIARNTSKMDLTFIVWEDENTIKGYIEYNTDLFSKTTIERMEEHYKNLFNAVLHDPTADIGTLPMLSASEVNGILDKAEGLIVDFPKSKTVIARVEEQVRRTPDHIALVSDGKKITYRELNTQANRLAEHLIRAGLKKTNAVGIVTEPHPDMIIAILAVLKAGGVFIPIDPAYPPSRIEYIIRNSVCDLLLVQKEIAGLNCPVPVIGISTYQYKNEENYAETKNDEEDSVYIIYTSGTSGNPKGVRISNANLNNYLNWFIRTCEITGNDNTVLASSFAFDMGYTNIFSTLITGGTLHLVSREVILSPSVFLQYIADNRLTYIKITPTLLSALVNSAEFNIVNGRSLTRVVLGGEQVNCNDLEKAHSLCPQIRFMNEYGPTETTIGTIAQFIDFGEFHKYKKYPTVGNPIYNTQAFIMDKNGQLVPEGIPGELVISGECVGAGYVNNPELTAQKFISNPFDTSRKAYRTGDFARMRPNGKIEYLGRRDLQVKVRGYRIEPEEIVIHLLGYNGVKQAIVQVDHHKRNPDNKYLCAYMVASPAPDVNDLRSFLLARLPEYMIPAFFIFMDHIPVTANGKTDLKALPKPDARGQVLKAPAATAMEETLLKIWAEILDIEEKSIGTNDSFFELGGYSLKAMMMISRINRMHDVNIPLAQIFRTPTIKDFALFVTGASKTDSIQIVPLAKKHFYPLSSAQKRVFFLQQLEGVGTSYNSPFLLKFEGKLDRGRIENTYRKLIQRHETLRTSFHLINNEPVQVVHDEVPVIIEELGTHTSDKIREVINGFVRPFDIACAPLFRVGLIQLNAEEYLLVHDIHHIVSDGTSKSILEDDLMDLYEDRSLPEMKIQYKDFAAWQNNLFASAAYKKQLDYWLSVYADGIPSSALATDYLRSETPGFSGGGYGIYLDAGDTEALRTCCKKHEVTLFMYLLSAINILLHKYTGQEDVVIGSSIFGRPEADFQRIIGMFVNKLAIRNFPAHEKTFIEFMQEVKRNSIKAFDNQQVQFEDLVDKLKLKRDLSRNPLFDISLVVQNFEKPRSESRYFKSAMYDIENRTAKFDISLMVFEVKDQVYFYFEYRSDLFTGSTIMDFAQRYISVIKQALGNERLAIKDFRLKHDFVEVQPAMPTIEFEFSDSTTTVTE